MNESSSNICDDVVFWMDWFWEEESVGWHMLVVCLLRSTISSKWVVGVSSNRLIVSYLCNNNY